TGSMPDGKMTPEFYNSLGAMHGTIMIFLGVVPLAFAAFGNFVVPLQIGAPDMTFPKVNAASYWAFVVGGIIMLVSFFVPGGAAVGSSNSDAVHGSRCLDQLFHADRAGGERSAVAGQRRRQPAVMATFVLVPRSPGSLRPDFARHGHRGRNPC